MKIGVEFDINEWFSMLLWLLAILSTIFMRKKFIEIWNTPSKNFLSETKTEENYFSFEYEGLLILNLKVFKILKFLTVFGIEIFSRNSPHIVLSNDIFKIEFNQEF